MGSKAENWNLYRRSLEECGRVCIPETGRAIFLTHDTKAIAAVSLHMALVLIVLIVKILEECKTLLGRASLHELL